MRRYQNVDVIDFHRLILYKLKIEKLYNGGEPNGDSDPEGIFRESTAGEI